jgi:hypothetical protein
VRLQPALHPETLDCGNSPECSHQLAQAPLPLDRQRFTLSHDRRLLLLPLLLVLLLLLLLLVILRSDRVKGRARLRASCLEAGCISA